MNTLFIGKNFVSLEAVGSTNTFAATLLSAGPPDGTVVFSSQQSEGRGQQGNKWLSAPGKNIAFTLILFPRFMPASRVFLLNKMLSCALYDALTELLPEVECTIKWPNDMLLNGRKVAGMLIENHLERGGIASSLIGVGINVNQLNFPEADYGPATSIAKVTGREFDLHRVLDLVLEKIEGRYLGMRAGRTEQVEMDYLQRLYGYQEDIEVEIEGERKAVHLVGVDGNGRLALLRNGKMAYFGIKEVKFCL